MPKAGSSWKALRPGRHEMVVDGSSAGHGGREYAQFVIGVEVESDEVTRLPYTIFVPRIRHKDWVRIDAPVQRDTMLTHPDIPGLEIHDTARCSVTGSCR